MLICLLAAAVAAGWREWQPAGLAWSGAAPDASRLSWEQVRVLAQKQPVVWVDARSAEKFAAGHVPDAVNLQLAAWDAGLAALLPRWKPESLVVVYCDDPGCGLSEQVAQRLRAAGMPTVVVLDGGWAEAQKMLVAGKDGS
jgi:3-mercaptopyruvate sulfurtransferase SseA